MKIKKELKKALAVTIALMLLFALPFSELSGIKIDFVEQVFNTQVGAIDDYPFSFYVMLGGAVIYDCDDNVSGELTLPETLDGYPLNSIETSAFSNCSGLTAISVPNTVEHIGEYAFSGCVSLKKVTLSNGETDLDTGIFSGCSSLTDLIIPNSIEEIGSSAFSGCSSLIDIYIPHGVKYIADNAFNNCSGLENLTVSSENTVYHSEGNCIINTALKKLVRGCKTSTIPSDGSVTSIGSSAFSGCTGLTDVTIPDSVTSIAYGAFSGCSGLMNVTVDSKNTVYHSSENCIIKTSSKELILGCKTSVIPSDGSVTSIGFSAFSGCTGLTDVTIPDSVTSIANGTFSGCSGLMNVTVDSKNTVYHSSENCIIKTSSKELVFGCKTSVIPSDGSVTSIVSKAFSGCTQLTTMSIPEGITDIQSSAFYGCTNLKSVIFPNSLTTIAQSTFELCVGLTDVQFADGLTTVAVNSFKDCSALTDINIQGDQLIISSDAFEGCVGLTRINIGSGVVSIDSSAFYGCCGLESIVVSPENPVYHSLDNCIIETSTKTLVSGCKASIIPSDGSVTIIGVSAFAGCADLPEITIPDTVVEIGAYAFANCSGLKDLSLSDNLEIIGEGAFGNCTELTSVTIPGAVTDFGQYAFYQCYKLTDLVFFSGLTTIGQEAFEFCTSLKSLTFPDTLTSINSDAFIGCGCLEELNVSSKNEVYYSENNCIIESVTKTLTFGCKTSVIPSDGSVTRIGEGAFAYCFGLTDMVIPDSVKGIGGAAFHGCAALTEIVIPDSVTSIDDYAFAECSKLRKIALGKNLESIGKYAFDDCGSLNSITIPDGVKKIGNYAFSGCAVLTELVVPDGVTDIGRGAFNHCAALTTASIPKSVKTIVFNTFTDCVSLTDVYYSGTQDEWLLMNVEDTTLLVATIHYSSSFDNGILCVTDNNAFDTPLTANEKIQSVIIDGNVDSVRSGYFKSLPNLGLIVVKAENVGFENGSVSNCPELKNIVFLNGGTFDNDSFVFSDKKVNVFVNEDVTNQSTEFLNIVKYSFEANELFLSGVLNISFYDFFDIVAAFCQKYDNIEKLSFSDVTFSDVEIKCVDYDNDFVLEPIENNHLINAEIYPGYSGHPDDAISYNRLVEEVSDGTVETVVLIMTSTDYSEPGDIDPVEVGFFQQIGETIKEITQKFLKSVVAFFKTLFKFFGK